MKPLTLKIRGFNSFDQEQTIDFEALTARGLFGIFGPTGSGKSSIVDAITMVIYGKIARYEGERGPMECINANHDTMSLSLTFSLLTGYADGAVYVVERSYKRNQSSIASTLVRLYRKDASGVTVIADKSGTVTEEIEKLIGLSYKDFSRSVILPQGKFSDFLLLPNRDRGSMLERIFKLEKYGEWLYRRTKDEWNKTNASIRLIDGSLELYGGITEELLQEKQDLYINLEKRLAEAKEQQQAGAEAYERLRTLFAYRQEWESYQKLLADTLAKADELQTARTRLTQAKKAAAVKDVLAAYEETAKKLEVLRQQSVLETQRYADLEKKLDTATAVYEEALHQKENRLPLLIEQETKGKQALETSQSIRTMETDRQALRAQYQSLQNGRRQYAAAEEEQKEKLSTINQCLEETAQKKNTAAVDPAYREQIEAAHQLEEQTNDQQKKSASLQSKLDQLLHENKKESQSLEQLMHKAENLRKEADETAQRKATLNAEKPGDANAFLSASAEFYKTETAFLRKNEQYDQIRILSEEWQTNIEKITETGEKLSVLEQQIAEEEKKREQWLLLRERERLNELSFVLAETLSSGAPCPVCGSTEHPSPAAGSHSKANQTHEQTAFETKLAAFENDRQLLRIQSETSKNEQEKRRRQLDALKQELAGFQPVLEKEKNEQEKIRLSAWKVKLEDWERENETEAEKTKSLTQELHQTQVAMTGAEERIRQNTKHILEWETEKKAIDEKIRADILLLRQYETTLHSSDFKALRNHVRAMDKDYSLLEKTESQLRLSQEEARKLVEEARRKLTEMDTEMEKILAVGKEKAETIENMRRCLTTLMGDADPAACITDAQKQTAEINGSLSRAQQIFEQCTREKQTAGEAKASLFSQQQTLEDILTVQKSKMEQALAANGFTNPEEACRFIIEPEETERLERAVTDHDRRLQNLRDNLSRLAEKPENHDASRLFGDKSSEEIRDTLETARIKTIENSEAVEQAARECAVLKQQIQRLLDDFAKVSGLTAQKKELEYRAALLADLVELFEGKKFVDYIAQRQLKTITAEATRRLKAMTSGRYALELDGAEFVIRDDYNGGMRRSPRTLSGGETFMVSLCLALALSSKIQMKNSAPLSFFFLDEGFGTLDPVTLDVVMGCLERLQIEKLSVGVITHVEELKNRIPSKLTVTPPEHGLHGTRVTVTL